MDAYYKDKHTAIYVADCRDLMRFLPENSVDAIVTDPPYEIGFMAKSWDAAGVAFEVETWRLALRVAKPGAHLVAFGAPRSYHRLAVAIEDAGWEIRDSLMWMFGSGFPKSRDISKEFDRLAGAEREIVGRRDRYRDGVERKNLGDVGDLYNPGMGANGIADETAPATDLARQWDGWGTALKPAYEPIVLARKPLTGTIARNVEQHGTGGLNIDGTRIGVDGGGTHSTEGETVHGPNSSSGRWPANVVLDEEAAAILDGEVGDVKSGIAVQRYGGGGGYFTHIGDGTLPGNPMPDGGYRDRGGPSRFFYTAKASRSEREAGLDGFAVKAPHELSGRKEGSAGQNHPRVSQQTGNRRNVHPTVKPVSLMAWLVRLITPPNGIVLDPFLGSGSTRLAAQLEEKRFVGCDLSEEYVQIALSRTANKVAPLVEKKSEQRTKWESLFEPLGEDAKYVNARPTLED